MSVLSIFALLRRGDNSDVSLLLSVSVFFVRLYRLLRSLAIFYHVILSLGPDLPTLNIVKLKPRWRHGAVYALLARASSDTDEVVEF